MVLECSGFGGGMVMPEDIRYIRKNELESLLDLYTHLNKDDPKLEENEKISALWESILDNPSQHYLVAEADGRIVSSCVLVVIENLTRGARPYGLIENVVTHEEYRNKGYGTRLLKKALEIAQETGCYKVMLMSARGEETLKFYDRIGFERGKKTGFIVKF
jgi:GNAT superfamily N-acetyltransferase